MSEFQFPAGQFMPPVRNRLSSGPAPNRPAAPSRPPASFGSVLRLQSSNGGGPAGPMPSNPRTETLSPANAPSASVSGGAGAFPSNPEVFLLPETLSAMPAGPEEMEQNIIQNWSDYRRMKDGGAEPANQGPSMQTHRLPDPETARLNAARFAARGLSPSFEPESAPPQPLSFSEAMRGAESGQPAPADNGEVVFTEEEAREMAAMMMAQQAADTPDAPSANPTVNLDAEASAPAGETKPSEAPDTERKGFFEAVGSFFENIGAAMTLGFYHPRGETEPEGWSRAFYPFKKLAIDAPKSLIYDAPMGIARSLDKNGGEETREREPGRTEEPSKYGSKRFLLDGGVYYASKRRHR